MEAQVWVISLDLDKKIFFFCCSFTINSTYAKESRNNELSFLVDDESDQQKPLWKCNLGQLAYISGKLTPSGLGTFFVVNQFNSSNRLRDVGARHQTVSESSHAMF